uniref:Uncharacterized protein n=1 Tax=Anguilla anguilla TaxID=7936 RepID=A0A0E9QHR4_ANGAN
MIPDHGVHHCTEVKCFSRIRHPTALFVWSPTPL